jgi:NAD(P)-dependent dehydrogenase (short-subunit alcohol dehydrogenase family)
MPPIPPPCGIAGEAFFSGFSATIASVVTSRPATDAALRTAGVELAKHNILVVGVAPGAVATPINLGTMNDPAKLAQAGLQRHRVPDRRRKRHSLVHADDLDSARRS